jgi:hypothetical protein
MIDNYLKLGLSAPAIAKLVKVHPETIRRYVRIDSPAALPPAPIPAVFPTSVEPAQKTATVTLW